MKQQVAAIYAVSTLALLLAACSASEPNSDETVVAEAVTSATSDQQNASIAPGESLAFEWSANGFEQVPSEYKWMGTGRRDDVYQPNFSLSVPETDDIIWSSSCEAGGRVTTQMYFVPPKNMKRNNASFKFETDKSTKTLEYQTKYMPSGQAEGFQLIQSANDPMFAEMKAGSWAYIQIGEGSDAVKQRISLANAAKSLNAFLPACSAPKKVAVKPTPATVTYACKDGRSIKATYLGNDTDIPIVRLEVGGEQYLLSQIVAGSGARYDNSGEKQADKRRTWHNKGKGSLFIETDWDDVDGNNETIVHCLEP